VSTSGSTNLDGVTDWVTGDWAVFIEQGGTDAWEKIDNSSVLDGAGTGQKIAKWDGSGTSNTLADSIITEGSSNIIIGGALGVGTSSAPARELEVTGDGNVYVRLTAKLDTDSTAIELSNTQETWQIRNQDTNDDALQFMSDTGATALTIQKTGNVGIGTTSPDTKLEIVDTSNPGADSGSVIIEGRRDGSPNVLTLRARDASAPTVALPNGQGPVVRFQGFDGTDFENMAYIQVAADGQAVADADAPSYMAFGTSADGSSSPTERMRISSAGAIKFNAYGQEDFTGTLTYLLGVEADGDVIEVGASDLPGGPYLPLSAGSAVPLSGDLYISSAKIANEENTDIDVGTEVVAQVAIATFTAAFFDFVVKKGTNVRSGTVFACHDGTNVEYAETSTVDLGDTSDLVLSVDKTSTNLRLIATAASNDWSVKSLIRAI